MGVCTGQLPQYVAQFNGQTGVITVPSSTMLQSSIFTYSAWITPISSTTRTIIGGSANGNPQFRVEVAATLGLVKGGIVNIGTSTSAVQNNVWNFVAVTYDSYGNYVFYINGVNAGSGTNLQAFVWSNSMLIGQRSSELFNGYISNVQIYNTSLSANQIQALYLSGIGGAPMKLQNLAGWWPLNGNANDYSGNNNNGVPTAVTFTSQYGK